MLASTHIVHIHYLSLSSCNPMRGYYIHYSSYIHAHVLPTLMSCVAKVAPGLTEYLMIFGTVLGRYMPTPGLIYYASPLLHGGGPTI